MTGQAELERQDFGVYVYIELDCLHASGDLAVVSGVVTSSNSATLPVGIDELFVINDNGDGPADEITLVFDGLGLARTICHPTPRSTHPFVVWFDDTALADALVDAGAQSNNDLEAIYTAAGLAVAEVEAALSTTDFTIQPDELPLHVQRLCQSTLMCAFGDPHPNQEDSGVIAQAFEDVLPDG